MPGALARLDTSPRSVARRGLVALAVAAGIELGVVAVAEAADWPAGAFYAVSALSLAILVAVLVPIIEPPRTPPIGDDAPRPEGAESITDTIEGTTTQELREAASKVPESSWRPYGGEFIKGWRRLEQERRLARARAPAPPLRRMSTGRRGMAPHHPAEDDVEREHERVITQCNVAFARMAPSRLERVEGSEFTDLLRSIHSGDLWSLFVFSPPPSWQELERSWLILDAMGWPISEIAGELGTSVANVHQLRSRALRRLRDELSSGDVSSWTYQCTQCGYELQVGSTEHLPPCPNCGHYEYRTLSRPDSVHDPYRPNPRRTSEPG